MDKPRGFYPLTVSSTLARRAKCFIKMNYKKIYNNIINRAKTRVADSDTYYERHHIVPRCLNGTDDKENLVLLTGSEHRTAHLCLVKMYPDHHGLVKAAMMMDVCASKTHKRSKSKQYSWLKKLHQEVISVSQTGENNSQFGTLWIFNIESREERKVSKTEVAEYIAQGWVKGRVNSKIKTCKVCNKTFVCTHRTQTCSDACFKKLKFENQVFAGREQEFLDLYAKLNSMNKALKAMGFPGAVSHYYKWAKTLI